MNKRWRTILLFVGLPILVGGLVYWFAWAGTTKPIESVADQLKAPSLWKLVQSNAKAPGLCIAETCPNLTRIWTMEKTIMQSDLQNIVKASGWDGVIIDDECESIVKDMNGGHVCSMHGDVNGYEISIYVAEENSRFNQPTVSLNIR